MLDFVNYAPSVLNFILLGIFFIDQFFICRFVQLCHFSAADMIEELFARPSLIVMPIIISVFTFVFYEMFIFNIGTDFSAVCMLFAYYLIPMFAGVYFCYYMYKLYRLGSSRVKYNINYIAVIITGIILAALFLVLCIMFSLPLVCISFVIPFMSCFYAAGVKKRL